MTDYSKIASESMENLTERVINADMAQRKRKMIQFSAMRSVRILYIPVAFYFIYNTIHIKGTWKSVNAQAGDPYNLFKIFMGKNLVPIRQVFRPEIYHHHEFIELMEYAKLTQQEVSKNENIKFKPYVWH